MSDSLAPILTIASVLMVAVGGLVTAVGLFRWVSHREYGGGGGFSAICGIVLMLMGWLLPILFNSLTRMLRTLSGEPAPTSTATPSATATPTATPTPPVESDPIVLPRVENLETLWLIPLGLLLLAAAWFAVGFGRRELANRRAEQQRQAKVRAEAEAKWAKLVERHRALEAKVLHAETDWDMLFSYPALTDVNVPTTAAMFRAMNAASSAEVSMPEENLERATTAWHPYAQAVDDFALAWEAAYRHAKRLGQAGIPAEERKTVAEIRTLLAMAENSGSSDLERRHAYSRAQRLMGELTSYHLPEKALAQVEAASRLMLNG